MNSESDYMQETKGSLNNILVAVRVRPLSESELHSSPSKIVEVLDSNVLILLDPSSDKSIPEVPRVRTKEKQYAFDMVLGEQATQEQVFHHTTSFLLEGVANGYNASVFAYGPTGAGKTYTMIGTAQKPGVMLHTFAKLFSHIDAMSRDRQYKVTLSYLEIYNENIKDLLNPSKEGLDVREDPQRGMVVAGLTEILASSPSVVFSYIRNGNKRRVCEPTQANRTSSRSHAILQIGVEYRDRAGGTESEICIGKLSLIDLAGSERAANTHNRGKRLIEGANINKSLLSLGNCINALCELNEKGGQIHVPYRDSKLTRLLKDSLGGNCRTVMITCISPSNPAYEDTYNTLIYANRAKNIKTKVEKNSLNVQFHISRYTSIIKQLKQEVMDLRGQLGNSVSINPDVEGYLIEINRHFQDEARIRKNIYMNEQKIDNLGFSIFAKQAELIEISMENGEQNGEYAKRKSEINGLLGSIRMIEAKVEEGRRKLGVLEAQREELEMQWLKAGVTEPYISHLALEMKKHSIMMNSLDFEGKENHNKLVIEQKDMYIKLLEEQLKLRDSLIESEMPKFSGKTLKKLKSFDQINSHFVGVHSLSSSPNKKSSVNFSLPSISKSRIPKPRFSEIAQSDKIIVKREHKVLPKEDSRRDLKYSNKYKSRNRANSTESRLSEGSAASTYAENKARISRISEKYSSSPYVKYNSKTKQIS